MKRYIQIFFFLLTCFSTPSVSQDVKARRFIFNLSFPNETIPSNESSLFAIPGGDTLWFQHHGAKSLIFPNGFSGINGHVIKNHGSPLTQRPALNFTGSGVTASDNVSGNQTDVTINTPDSVRASFISDTAKHVPVPDSVRASHVADTCLNCPSGSGNPANPVNSIQFNRAGSFAGSDSLQYLRDSLDLIVASQAVMTGVNNAMFGDGNQSLQGSSFNLISGTGNTIDSQAVGCFITGNGNVINTNGGIFATGSGNTASGNASAVFGEGNTASGEASLAGGNQGISATVDGEFKWGGRATFFGALSAGSAPGDFDVQSTGATKIGAGSNYIKKVLSDTFTFDFPLTAAGTTQTTVFNFPGLATDSTWSVVLTFQSTGLITTIEGGVFTYWQDDDNNADDVIIQFTNTKTIGAIDLPPILFRLTATKF